MATETTTDVALYRDAERAFLESEGLETSSQMVELERLGGSMRVVVAGEGPPVLFVPGVMTTGVSFAGLVKYFPDYRCIMLDRPGTGLSPLLPSPPKALDEHERTADALVVDLLDGLGIEQAHAVCASLGGWTTFRTAAAHPGRLTSIFGCSWLMGARVTGIPWSMRMPSPTWALPRRVRAPRSMASAMLKSGGMKSAVEQGKFSEPMIDYLYALLRRTETFRNDSMYSPRPFTPRGPSDDVRLSDELLGRVDVPVHLFWGTDDLFGDVESAREFAAALPWATLQLVEDGGHAPFIDEPELAVQAIRDHLVAARV